MRAGLRASLLAAAPALLVACGDDATPTPESGCSMEVCNGVDDDCDGLADDADPDVFVTVPAYTDADGDGWGTDPVIVCDRGSAAVDRGGDCDDTLADVNPEAPEVCNGRDDDCDGVTDDADPEVTAFEDLDGDGWGGEPARTCDGAVDVGGDCDDDDPAVNPEAVEACDGADNDCDGCPDPGCEETVDLGCAEARYLGPHGYYDGTYAGIMVAGAGDVDGDGLRDLLVATGDGGAALILGTSAPTDVEVYDTDAYYYSGWFSTAVAGAGDVDGDGLADVILGDAWLDKAYLVLGTPVPTDVDVYAGGWDATFDGAGEEVSAAGDFDGDGFDDVLVAGSGRGNGAIYLFGGSAVPADRRVAEAEASWSGSSGEDAGVGLAPAGDLDGDGLDDFLVAASGAVAVYVLLGTSTPTDLALSAADAALAPWPGSECAGSSVAGADDVNGDGHRDIVFGTPCEDGAAWLALGAATTADITTTAGYTGAGEAGESVAGPGDIDGDGFADIAVGAPLPYEEAGAVYVIRGSPAPASQDLWDSDVILVGEAPGSVAGRSIAAPGDVDGDGRPDLLVGAPGFEIDYGDNGAAYLLLSLLDG